MKDDKRGGRKPAPVPTGHDQRAAARDHSTPHGNRKNDVIPPSKAATDIEKRVHAIADKLGIRDILSKFPYEVSEIGRASCRERV